MKELLIQFSGMAEYQTGRAEEEGEFVKVYNPAIFGMSLVQKYYECL